MADCLEITRGSLYMDQLLRDLPQLREWIEEFELKERFVLYTEYNEPRYCFEAHCENEEFIVHVVKLTDDLEFFGDLMRQIKKMLPHKKMPITIVMEEESGILWRQLKWKRFTKEVQTDMYNRKRIYYRSKR